MVTNLKIQFISRDLPVEGSGGTSAYRLSFLRYLHKIGCNIEYLLLGYKRNQSIQNAEDLHRFDNFMTVKQLNLSTNDLAPVWSDLPTKYEINYVQKQVERYKPDLLIADHPWLGEIFSYKPKDVVKAILTHDVQYKKIQEFKKAGLNPYKRNNGFEQPRWDEKLERQCLSRADIIISIQKEDYACFKQILPNSEVVNMPMAASVLDTKVKKQITGRCLFIGGGASHNIHGLTWFLHNIWPKIIHENPSASLHVCGDVCNGINIDEYNKQAQIIFRGRIKNLFTEYEKASVCIVPLMVGSGLKLKLIEAMSYGRACISTKIGVQGIEAVSEYGVVVVDDAEDFAIAVLSLLNNSQKRELFEIMNKQFVRSCFSPDVIYGQFVLKVYKKVPRFQRYLYR